MTYLKPAKVISIVFYSLMGAFFTRSFASNFPEAPGISATGLYGDVNSGFADALIPLRGQAGKDFFFIDSQGFVHSFDEYSLSMGGGYRVLQDQWGILSAYVFADYNHSVANNSFWFVSPGLQRLGDSIDIAANLYVPIHKKVNTGQTFADNIGMNDSVSFSGHDQIDQLVNTFESTGMGGDAEIGVRVPFLKNNTKIYVGGYYFAPEDNNSVVGGSARVSIPLDEFFALNASEAYDSEMHNTIKIGLTVFLGGRDSSIGYDGDLQQRMVDPVQRSLAAMAGGAHTMEPVLAGYQMTGDYEIERSNIWFFSPDGMAPVVNPSGALSLTDCTADAPCAFTQNTVNSVNNTIANANLYVDSGQYTPANSGASLVLNEGQSLFGRDDRFTAAAAFNKLPTIFGALELTGNNQVEHIELMNDGSQAVGVRLDDGAQNVLLNKVLIGADGSNPSAAYATGIQLGNNDDLVIKNSTINAFATNYTISLSAGVKLDNVSGSHLKISNSVIDVSGGQGVNVAGVFIGNDQSQAGDAENNQVTLSKDQINVSSEAANRAVFGVYLGNYFTDNSSQVANNQLNISHSHISADSTSGNTFGLFVGNYEYMAPLINNNKVTMTDSTDTASSGSANAYGVFEGMFNGDNRLAQNNQLLISGSQIQATSVQNSAFGVELDGYDSTFTLNNNLIEATAQSNINYRRFVFGINLQGGNDILNLRGNRIISTGEGNNVLVVGLGEGIFYDVPNNNLVNSTADVIIARSASNNANVNGVFIQGQSGTVNMSGDVVRATVSGRDAGAIAVNVAGDSNQLTIANSSLQAIATGINGVAMGVAANSGYPDYASASHNMITLSGDHIMAFSALGRAWGVADNLQKANSNTWDIATSTTISAYSFFNPCSTYFNGICVL